MDCLRNLINRFSGARRFVDEIMESKSVYSRHELEDMEQLTYLTKNQILRLHRQFCSFLDKDDEEQCGDLKNPTLPAQVFLNMPELVVNPFKDRILKVFASNQEYVSFDDFLDMMSVFSDRAPLKVKTRYAFRIYDFDEDEMLAEQDVSELVRRLRGDQPLSEEDRDEVVRRVFTGIDLDSDGYITFPEFEYFVHRNPDFRNSFRIRI